MKKILTMIIVALVTISGQAVQTYQEAISTGAKELKEKKYDAAATAFGAAAEFAETSKDKATAYWSAGSAMVSAKNHAKAEEFFKKVLAIEDSHAVQKSSAQYYIGHFYFVQKKYPEAIIEFKKVFLIDNAYKGHVASARRDLARSQYYGNDYDAAAETFNEIIHDKNTLTAHRVEAQRFLGNIKLQKKEYDEAITEYNKIKDIVGIDLKDVAEADYEMGSCYFYQLKEYDNAKVALEKVINNENATKSTKEKATKILERLSL